MSTLCFYTVRDEDYSLHVPQWVSNLSYENQFEPALRNKFRVTDKLYKPCKITGRNENVVIIYYGGEIVKHDDGNDATAVERLQKKLISTIKSTQIKERVIYFIVLVKDYFGGIIKLPFDVVINATTTTCILYPIDVGNYTPQHQFHERVEYVIEDSLKNMFPTSPTFDKKTRAQIVDIEDADVVKDFSSLEDDLNKLNKVDDGTLEEDIQAVTKKVNTFKIGIFNMYSNGIELQQFLKKHLIEHNLYTYPSIISVHSLGLDIIFILLSYGKDMYETSYLQSITDANENMCFVVVATVPNPQQSVKEIDVPQRLQKAKIIYVYVDKSFNFFPVDKTETYYASKFISVIKPFLKGKETQPPVVAYKKLFTLFTQLREIFDVFDTLQTYAHTISVFGDGRANANKKDYTSVKNRIKSIRDQLSKIIDVINKAAEFKEHLGFNFYTFHATNPHTAIQEIQHQHEELESERTVPTSQPLEFNLPPVFSKLKYPPSSQPLNTPPVVPDTAIVPKKYEVYTMYTGRHEIIDYLNSKLNSTPYVLKKGTPQWSEIPRDEVFIWTSNTEVGSYQALYDEVFKYDALNKLKRCIRITILPARTEQDVTNAKRSIQRTYKSIYGDKELSFLYHVAFFCDTGFTIFPTEHKDPFETIVSDAQKTAVKNFITKLNNIVEMYPKFKFSKSVGNDDNDEFLSSTQPKKTPPPLLSTAQLLQTTQPKKDVKLQKYVIPTISEPLIVDLRTWLLDFSIPTRAKTILSTLDDFYKGFISRGEVNDQLIQSGLPVLEVERVAAYLRTVPEDKLL